MTPRRKYEHHGGTHTKEYRVWFGILVRCYNKKFKHYGRYGGRGITVCDEWKNSFAAFLRDMGPRPHGATIERKNNDLGYCKDNCCWATRREQSYNRCNNVPMTVNGVTKSIAEWAQVTGLPYDLIYYRKQIAGWPDEKCLIPKTKENKMMVYCDGKAYSTTTIAKMLGISLNSVHVRIRSGWSPKEIVNRPNSQPYMKKKAA